MNQDIAVKNYSSVVSDHDITAALPSFQKQMSGDFAPAWGLDATFHFVSKTEKVPSSTWLIVVLDDADQAGALGYHDLGTGGQPLSKVFAKTTKTYGGLWQVTFTHEALEMRADPNINLTALDENHNRAYCYESCDAVEADNLAYKIDGVPVSDFVLPGWFEPTHIARGEKFAFKSPVKKPFQLMAGGYIAYLDLVRGTWNQVEAKEVSDAKDLHAHERQHEQSIKSRPKVGSRRERRRTPKVQWIHSTRD